MAQTTGVLQVAIIQMEVLILDMVDVLPVEMTSPADKAMDLISFLQEKLSEIRTILSRDSSYKGFRNSTTIFLSYENNTFMVSPFDSLLIS
jgi:hypothetical protein